jgi:hypothetical protein
MKSIWKFEFKIDDDVDIEMPEYAEILHVDVQFQRNPDEVMTHPMGREVPCIWARVDAERPMVKRNFFIAGTGNPLPENMLLEHLGSFKMEQDRLVWHLFEKIQKRFFVTL